MSSKIFKEDFVKWKNQLLTSICFPAILSLWTWTPFNVLNPGWLKIKVKARRPGDNMRSVMHGNESVSTGKYIFFTDCDETFLWVFSVSKFELIV